MKQADTYMCALCRGTFNRETPESEALAELELYFGETSAKDCDIVCEDCWQKIRPSELVAKQ